MVVALTVVLVVAVQAALQSTVVMLAVVLVVVVVRVADRDLLQSVEVLLLAAIKASIPTGNSQNARSFTAATAAANKQRDAPGHKTRSW